MDAVLDKLRRLSQTPKIRGTETLVSDTAGGNAFVQGVAYVLPDVGTHQYDGANRDWPDVVLRWAGCLGTDGLPDGSRRIRILRAAGRARLQMRRLRRGS